MHRDNFTLTLPSLNYCGLPKEASLPSGCVVNWSLLFNTH